MYSVSLSILGKETKLQGNSLVEIFDLIKPEVVKGKAIMTIKKGNLKAEHMFYPHQLKRLMVNKTMKQIWEKRLNLMLK